MQEFRLPDLGEGMHEAEIRRWLVKPGDSVKLDQPMLEVETDKAVVEIPAPVSGRVAEIKVPEGKVAQLGEVLVTFENGATASSSPSASASVQRSVQSDVAAASASSAGSNGSGGSATVTRPRVLAAPAVRKRAFELGIDLAQVPASHPSGRVTMDDLETFARQAKAAPAQNAQVAQPAPAVASAPANGAGAASVTAPAPPLEVGAQEERQALTGLRRRIAERME